MKIIKYLNYLIASVLILIAIFLAYVALPFFGNKALIIKSGSMSPAIKTGDLVVVNFQNAISSPQSLPIPIYRKGTVIAFKELKNPSIIITHRVTSYVVKNNKVLYQTKGDANNIPDVDLIPQESVLGKSIITIPSLGKVFAATKSKYGFLILIIFPALAVITSESLKLIDELKKVIKARKLLQEDPQSKLDNQQLLGPLGIRVILPFVLGLMFFHNSYAYFSDSASSLNNTFQSAQSFPSPSPSSAGIANHIVISEVQITGGANHTTEDFIELYNPTSATFNLNGYKLVNRTTGSSSDNSIRIFTVSQSIAAHGYFLWCSTAEATLVTCDDSTTDTLSNDGSVGIRQISGGALIDALSWDSSANSLKEGTEAPDPSTAHQSLERKALSTSNSAAMVPAGTDELKGNGYDTDNNSTDFILRGTSQPQNSFSSTESP